MNAADPLGRRDDTRAALSSDEYRAAFELVMTGREAELTEDNRAAIARVRELTGHTSGYPMPLDT